MKGLSYFRKTKLTLHWVIFFFILVMLSGIFLKRYQSPLCIDSCSTQFRLPLIEVDIAAEN